jgi:radical SAM protein with 4Fe4S-binding SPASM domain
VALIEAMSALQVFWFTLGGGEPFARGDVFELMAEATRRNLCIRLTTNGFAVNEDTVRRLENLNVFSVQVSIDGLGRTHDRLRGMTGAFDNAIRTLELFRDAGYTTLATITASNTNIAEIPDIVRYLNRVGVNSVKIGPCVPLGRARQNRFQTDIASGHMRDLSRQMLQLQDQMNGGTALQLDGLFPFLFEPETRKRASAKQKIGPGCSAGVSQVVVSCKGEVYPCPYIRDGSAGNVRYRPLAEIWRNNAYFGPIRNFDPSQITGKCSDCGYRPHQCTGGCRGAAFATYGDLYAEDPNCWRKA